MQTSKLFILFCCTLALIPISTELEITNSLSLDFPLEPVLICWTIIGLFSFLYKPQAFKLTLQSPLFILLAIYVLWLLLNCIFSINPILSVKFLLAKCWYIIPFCLIFPSFIQNTKKHWTYIGLSLCLPMLVLVTITIVRHATTGFSFIGINKSLYPFFRNHVNYSALLVCLLPIAYSLYTSTPKESKQKKIILFALSLSLIALILAYSRGAWLVATTALVIPYIIHRKKITVLLVVAVLLIAMGGIFLAHENNYQQLAPNHDATIFHKKLSDHLRATVTLKDVSNAERIHRWVAGIRMVQHKPLTGFGTNSFYPTYKGYTISKFKTWVSNNPDHSSVHNYYLLVALEQGVPGLLIFIALLFYLLYQCQQLYHVANDSLEQTIARTASSILIMIMLLNFFSDLIETDKIGALFWLICTVVITLQIQTKKTERQHFSL
ncbi:MAG: hypothetical protein RL596_2640 [Bacteroidota bacterium]